MNIRGGGMLVGRDAELRLVGAFLREVGEGNTGILVVEAEAGGGKTHLLRHIIADVDGPAKGFAVLRAEGDPNDPRAMRCLGDALDCRLSSPDPTRARIAELLRAPRDRGEGVNSAIQELVIDVVERLALIQPVLLLFDDLHWIDDPTLAAIGSLARRLRGLNVGLLCATRPSARVRSALAAFSPRFVPLGPLSDDELLELAHHVTGRRPSAGDVAALRPVRTNPFLVSMLAATAASGQSGRVESAPPAAHDAFRRMAAGLDSKLRAFLELGAVAGREIDVEVLATANGERVSAAVAMARDATERGWLTSDDDGVRFRHDLLSEALLGSIPLERRDHLHLRLGRALVNLGHAPGRAAFHLEAASYLLSRADLPSVLVALGALPADDHVTLSLAERAYELDPANPEIVRTLMKCLAVGHRHPEAVALARPWLDRTATTGPDDSARIRLLAATSLVEAQGSDAARRLLRDGLDLPQSGQLRVDSLNLLARLEWYRRDTEGVRTAAGEALAVSREIRYVPGEIEALCSLSEASSLLGDLDDALRDAATAVQLTKERRGQAPVWPELALGTALISSGRFRDGMPVLTRSLHTAERSGDPVAMVLAQIVMQGSRFHTGLWDGFVADADAMADIGNDTGIRQGIVLPLGFASMVALRRGEMAALNDLSARLKVETTRGDANPGSIVGVLLGGLAGTEASGHFESACAKAIQLTELLVPVGYTAQSLIAIDVVRLAWITDNRDALRDILRLTTGGAERAATPTRKAMALWCAALMLDDVEQIVDAARGMAATERLWDGATALHIAGLVSARLNRNKAKPLFRDAAARYRSLGCPTHAEAALFGRGFPVLAGAVGGSLVANEAGDSRGRRPTAAEPTETGSADSDATRHGRVAGSSVRGTFDELSDAERRILQLVVEGRANGDIASELFVSKRTVESHVTSLYRKLGVTTRVALARAGVVQAS